MKSILLALAAIAFIPAYVQAEEGKGDREGRRAAHFAERDSDGSGTISRDEAGERMLEHFDRIDSDGDGELTKEELRAAAKKRHGKKKRKGPKPSGDSDQSGAFTEA